MFHLVQVYQILCILKAIIRIKYNINYIDILDKIKLIFITINFIFIQLIEIGTNNC